MAGDVRVEWIKKNVLNSLGLEESLFDEFCTGEQEGEPALDDLIYLLDNSKQCGCIFYVAEELEEREIADRPQPLAEEAAGEGEAAEAESSEGEGGPAAGATDSAGEEPAEPKPEEGTNDAAAAAAAAAAAPGEGEGEGEGTAGETAGEGAAGEEGGEGAAAPEAAVPAEAAPPAPHTEVICRVVLRMCSSTIPATVSNSKSVFFLKKFNEAVPIPQSLEKADEELADCFEVGCLNGRSLLMLEQVMSTIFLPLLSNNLAQAQTQAAKVDYDSDFLGNVKKFTAHMRRTIHHIEGDVKLSSLDEEDAGLVLDLLSAAKDPELLDRVRTVFSAWIDRMTGVLQQLAVQVPTEPGPLSELEFWVVRSSTLTALHEQLELPVVAAARQLIAHMHGKKLVTTFDTTRESVTKFYTEAKDNIKFLATLERHFKNLEAATSFPLIEDKLPSMMNALRMVWIISRHYNTDQRMVPLMQRIAWLLTEIIRRQINPRTILRKPTAEVKGICTEAKSVLFCWEETYLDVRRKIELSDRDDRWEFDRTLLFGDTNYMASICDDICTMSEVLEQFYNIFGDELKSVTGNPQVIDDAIVCVNELVDPIEELGSNMDPFDRKHEQEWKQVKARFYDKVKSIEKDAKFFIDESFRSLRSAEGAFDMLVRFQNIRSREAVNEQLQKKFGDVLEKFREEVDEIEAIFKKEKDSPPITKNQPPVAGAIRWAHSIFLRIKGTVVRFQSMEALLQSPAGKEAKARYVTVARLLRNYQLELHTQWTANVAARLPVLLKMHLLKFENPGEDPITSSRRDQSVIPFAKVRYEVNYDEDLKVLISEAKYLDTLMMEVPEIAVNVTLQATRNNENIDDMKKMLDRFHGILGSIDEATEKLLRDHINELGIVLSPGLRRLNWNSLGVADFIGRCNAAISKFEGVLFHVTKNAADIGEILESFENAKLFTATPINTKFASVINITMSMDGEGPPDPAPSAAEEGSIGVKEYCTLVGNEMNTNVEKLAASYAGIGPLLAKVAVSVVGADKSPLMSDYFHYWEMRVFSSLVSGAQIIHASSSTTLGTSVYDPDEQLQERPALEFHEYMNTGGTQGRYSQLMTQQKGPKHEYTNSGPQQLIDEASDVLYNTRQSDGSVYGGSIQSQESGVYGGSIQSQESGQYATTQRHTLSETETSSNDAGVKTSFPTTSSCAGSRTHSMEFSSELVYDNPDDSQLRRLSDVELSGFAGQELPEPPVDVATDDTPRNTYVNLNPDGNHVQELDLDVTIPDEEIGTIEHEGSNAPVPAKRDLSSVKRRTSEYGFGIDSPLNGFGESPMTVSFNANREQRYAGFRGINQPIHHAASNMPSSDPALRKSAAAFAPHQLAVHH